MRTQCNKSKGFTLLEMLMVLVIISSIIYMMIGYIQQRTLQNQMDRTAVQMQQILSASLSYHVNNGKWPVSLACLQGDTAAGADCGKIYLPSSVQNPFKAGASYTITSTNTMLTVTATIERGANLSFSVASIIANKLPLANVTRVGNANATCNAAQTACDVVASVPVPGQSLGDAGKIGFAGLYHHGGCVPVPPCSFDEHGDPLDAQVFIVPVSVSGVNDPGSSAVYPISSFTAYATGGDSISPPACSIYSDPTTTCGSVEAGLNYWRACLQVITEKGEVAETNTSAQQVPPDSAFPYEPWGGNVTLMAITRCQPKKEASGSDFTVFTR